MTKQCQCPWASCFFDCINERQLIKFNMRINLTLYKSLRPYNFLPRCNTVFCEKRMPQHILSIGEPPCERPKCSNNHMPVLTRYFSLPLGSSLAPEYHVKSTRSDVIGRQQQRNGSNPDQRRWQGRGRADQWKSFQAFKDRFDQSLRRKTIALRQSHEYIYFFLSFLAIAALYKKKCTVSAVTV